MRVGIPKESKRQADRLESRVAVSPQAIKKLLKKKIEVVIERGAGINAGFTDEELSKEGARMVEANEAWGAEIVFKVNKPSADEISKLKNGSLLVSLLEPYHDDGTIQKLADAKVNAMAVELIPRTSRAQSMDVLSSQANIAGYRAVLEATQYFPRFFPMMMTSAGLAKPAKLVVLGAGVAGLQAIATAKRLGASVEAFDVRPEVKEQIQSLGAKFLELDLGEQGSGQGGYARELSEEAKKKQQAALTEKLKKFDIVISTANIPGKKAPTLITEDAVKGMRQGSVIVDMAAATGGNCPLTETDRVVVKHGVTLIGWTDYPSRVAADASNFYAQNLVALISLCVSEKSVSEKNELQLNLEDDIIAASLVTHQGQVRKR